MRTCFIATLFLSILLTPFSVCADQFADQREQLVRMIAADVQSTRKTIDGGTLDQRVVQAMRSVPRHAFVPPDQRRFSYANRPLPIGHGQTISQPFIVMLMTDLLDLTGDEQVLEIGTGSGYQAAILAELVDRVYTVEIIEALARQVDATFTELGYDTIARKAGDGYYGWPEHAPYDAIIVTAGAGHVPPPLIAQLKPGGRMVIPVGSRFQVQQLLVVSKADDGSLTTRPVLPVRFVPLTGGH